MGRVLSIEMNTLVKYLLLLFAVHFSLPQASDVTVYTSFCMYCSQGDLTSCFMYLIGNYNNHT